eukprot:GILJ01027670.1.p3 GENE.GILJ01027670.1~~GILJ01027670.1.p3  ORF type:complete len:144 (+),score=15.82 GILJ01027670.1:909-1340(+)
MKGFTSKVCIDTMTPYETLQTTLGCRSRISERLRVKTIILHKKTVYIIGVYPGLKWNDIEAIISDIVQDALSSVIQAKSIGTTEIPTITVSTYFALDAFEVLAGLVAESCIVDPPHTNAALDVFDNRLKSIENMVRRMVNDKQ